MNESEETRSTLTDRQLTAIPYLLASRSLEEGARQARVAKNTLYSWLREEAFQTELKQQREKIVEAGLETLKAHVSKATEVIVGLLDSQNESIRHRAARDVIEFVVKTTENESLEERIEALEMRIKKQHGGWR